VPQYCPCATCCDEYIMAFIEESCKKTERRVPIEKLPRPALRFLHCNDNVRLFTRCCGASKCRPRSGDSSTTTPAPLYLLPAKHLFQYLCSRTQGMVEASSPSTLSMSCHLDRQVPSGYLSTTRGNRYRLCWRCSPVKIGSDPGRHRSPCQISYVAGVNFLRYNCKVPILLAIAM